MSGKALKEKAKAMALSRGSRYAMLRQLILDGFFDRPVSSEEVVRRIKETSGERWGTSIVQTYMKRFLREGIIHAVKPQGHSRNYWVLADVPRKKAILQLGKGGKALEIEGKLFSDTLTNKLGKNFRRELDELRDNFGKNGNCTAFLLRKILEKLILIVFGKNGKQNLLEDPARPGGWKGLQEMLEICTREKVHGLPFLTAKTANEIKGVKFLGDTAAHNPLVGVDEGTILPQMPYIITAYAELAKRL